MSHLHLEVLVSNTLHIDISADIQCNIIVVL